LHTYLITIYIFQLPVSCRHDAFRFSIMSALTYVDHLSMNNIAKLSLFIYY